MNRKDLYLSYTADCQQMAYVTSERARTSNLAGYGSVMAPVGASEFCAVEISATIDDQTGVTTLVGTALRSFLGPMPVA